MISEPLLQSYGAERKYLKRKEILFEMDTRARYYFQVESGRIKMNNFNEDGKEFIQGIFTSGMSFGEPPLFADINYPAHAEAVEESCIWQLKADSFFKLLAENPKSHLELTKTLAGRLHYKATMAAEISSESAEHRLLRLMDYFKEYVHQLRPEDEYVVELSRQQMADLTGLRVETVIRSIKVLERNGHLKLKDHKISR